MLSEREQSSGDLTCQPGAPVFTYLYKAYKNGRLRRRGGWPGSDVTGLEECCGFSLSLPNACSFQLSEGISKGLLEETGALSRSGMADGTHAWLSRVCLGLCVCL